MIEWCHSTSSLWSRAGLMHALLALQCSAVSIVVQQFTRKYMHARQVPCCTVCMHYQWGHYYLELYIRPLLLCLLVLPTLVLYLPLFSKIGHFRPDMWLTTILGWPYLWEHSVTSQIGPRWPIPCTCMHMHFSNVCIGSMASLQRSHHGDSLVTQCKSCPYLECPT